MQDYKKIFKLKKINNENILIHFFFTNIAACVSLYPKYRYTIETKQ